MKAHRWVEISRGGGKAWRCINKGCDVQRFEVPILGMIYTIRWGYLQTTRHPCPTPISQKEPDILGSG